MFLFLGLGVNSYSQWVSVPVPTSSGLNSAFFVDANTGYVAGGGSATWSPNTTDGIILKTTDGGTNWAAVYAQSGIAFIHIFVINGIVYSFGRTSSVQGIQDIVAYSNDDGINW